MARVNTKFLLIIFIVVSLIGGASGVFYLLRVKADSGRHIRLGDAFMEQAAYRKAHTSYGRAVNKDPGNAEYLARFRDSLLAITPDNREEARKFYLEYHGILDRAITYQGHDPQTYIDRINEIHFAARHGTSTSLWWEQMEEVAQRMWDKYASGAEPRRIEARLYRGLSRFRRARLLEPVELEEAEADLEAFLEVFPKSDLGWASLLEAHLVLADMAKSSDDPSGYLQRSAAATSTLARAEAAGADGPCLASARLTYMAIRLREGLADPSSEQAVTAAQLDLAAREYVDAVEAVMDEDDMFLAQALNLFVVYQTLGGTSTIELADGTSIVGIILPTLDSTLLIARRRDRLIDVAETFLERNPDRHWHRDRLAQLLLVRRELEAADEHAEVVLNATMGTVGFLTQFIDQLHRSAAGRLFDSCYVRWEFASDEDRVAAVEAAEKAMARVEPLVIDPARNSMFRRIVGRLALMKGDYEKAAVEFGELARTNPTRDGLLTAAMCFERIGNVGSAYSTMARLLENDRRNTRYLYESARLAGRIGLTEDAMAYLDDLFAIDPEHELGQSLMIRMRMQAGGTDQPFNELEEALREADRAIEAGDPATARATLLGALDEAPRDIQILNRLYIAAAASGDREEQLQWVDRMLELNPANDSLQRLRASLTNADDPLEGIRQYVAQLNLPESEAAVKLTRNFASLAAGQRATANRFESLGRGEDAAAATSLADLASAAAEEAAQRAETLAPNHPRLIEYRFRNALRDDRLVDAEEIIAAATRENADGAGGELFKGQLALARGDSASAARHLAAASAALPYSSYVNRLLGSAYVQTGDFAKAQDAYEDAYQNNPNDAQTATQYIRLLMQVGDEPRALSVARTTHRLMPNSILLREAWLSLEDRIGDRPFVLLKRRTLYAEDPKDAANAESLARFLVKTRPSEALLLDDAGNPRYAHSPWVRMSESDRNEIIESERAAWGQEADAILATLQTDFPGIQTTLLRSSLLRERGDIDGGAAVLAEALDGDLEREDALRVRLALSSYQRSVGRVDRAIATLREARALQDPAVREADLALGMLYAQAGAFDNALASLREVAAVNNDPSVERSIAFCMVKLEMYDEAQRRIEAAIDVGRNGYEEQMLLALIADARGDLAERSNESGASHFATAEQALTEASRLMPSRPEPYVERAQMQLRAFNREIATATPVEAERMRTQSSRLREALSELEQADSVKFGDPKTSLVRVKIFQAQ
ncbi:MAG: tetratricopeptide repeat protein, partial [Planctomycetota bacterium]